MALLLQVFIPLMRVMFKKSALIGIILSVVFTFTSSSLPATTTSLNIADFTIAKNIDKSIKRIFYDKIFLGHLGSAHDIPFASDAYRRPPNVSSSSFPTKYREFQNYAIEGDDLLKYIWKTVLKRIEADLKKYLKEQYEETSSVTSAVPHQGLLLRHKSINEIRPKIKIGSDYIEPAIAIKNTLNANFDFSTSYHTADEILKAKIFSRLSNHLEFSLQHIHHFDELDRQQRYLLNVEYRF